MNMSFLLDHIKMVKGALGVHNKTMHLEECLMDIENYQVYYAKRQTDGEKVKYYEVVFDKPEMINKFFENVKGKGLQIIWENSMNILIKQ